MFFLSILQTSYSHSLQNCIFSVQVRTLTTVVLFLTVCGRVMTTELLAEELDYEFKQDSVVRVA
jgi:hypothetical protein